MRCDNGILFLSRPLGTRINKEDLIMERFRGNFLQLFLVVLFFFAVANFLFPAGAAEAVEAGGDSVNSRIEKLLGFEYLEGDIIVKFKDEIAMDAVSLASVSKGLHSQAGAVFEKQFKGLKGLQQVKVSNAVSLRQALQSYLESPLVEYAEPNYIYHASVIPNDPSFGRLWGLHNTGQTGGTVDADIDAPAAWNLMTGANSVVIAVIDTGVDYNHADLNSNIWSNPGETNCSDRIDNDGNGYVDDCRGWDFANNDNNPMDDNDHGTHVSGTIAAEGNNGTGVTGINWKAKIMPLKFLDARGSGTLADAVEAILYANANGAHVISNSWGGRAGSDALRDAINASPAVVVCAAGNDGTNNDVTPNYPSNYTSANIIAVAATNDTDSLASFSNYGVVSVDVGAPGVNIYSTIANGGYASFSGTSMATPHVSGVAGLVKALNPGFTNLQIKNRILNTTDPKSSLSGKVLTGGRLSAYNALNAVVTAPDISASPTSKDFGTVAVGGVSAVQAFKITNKGNADLVIGGVYLTGTNPFQFSLPSNTCVQTTLSPSGSCLVDAQYVPTAVGIMNAKIGIESNDSDTGVLYINLTGIGGTLPDISASPASKDFGSVAVGSVSVVQTFTISNMGTADLVVSNVYLSGTNPFQFSLQQDTCAGATILPSGSCTLDAQYVPTATGVMNAKIGIESNDPDTGNLYINLTGIGVALPDISTSPASKDFGSVFVGSVSAVQVFTISNTGTADLVVSNVYLTGTNPFQFRLQQDTCAGATILPSGSCTMEAKYLPTKTGAMSAKIGIESNDPASPTLYISISGTGIANSPPVADPGGPYSGMEGQAITLDGSGSADSDGSISLYEWDVEGDGVYDYSSASPLQGHTYTQQGTYSINLRVTDNLGATSGAVTTATIADSLPVAGFSASPVSGITPLTVNFTDDSTGYAQPLSYAWDFDNNGTIDSSVQNPSYVYSSAGIFSVSLTVTDSDGSASSLTRTDYITACLSPVRRGGATPLYYSSIQAAYDAAVDGDTIESRAVAFTEDLAIDLDKSVILSGGYDCDYSNATGVTTINGTMTISGGSVLIEGLVVE